MDSSNAEKAWRAWRDDHPSGVYNVPYVAFMAGRASRDAEVEVLREQLAAAEAAKADTWDEGAAANWDGQDLRYPNPYRTGDTNA